jgi:hypothetical protein
MKVISRFRAEPSNSSIMTKRWRIPIAVACVGLSGWLGWRAWPRHDPVYREKPLSYWLKGFDIGYNSPAKPSYDESVEAVRQTSTNSLPILLRMLRTRDSDLKHRLARLAQKQRLVKIDYVSADRERWAARQGFTALGSQAKVAIPQLVEIAREEKSRSEWHKYATEILELLKEREGSTRSAITGFHLAACLRSLGSQQPDGATRAARYYSGSRMRFSTPLPFRLSHRHGCCCCNLCMRISLNRSILEC